MGATLLAMSLALACLFVVPEVLFASRLFDRLPHAGLAAWGSMCVAGWLSTVVFFVKVGIDPGRTPLWRAVPDFVRHLGDGHPLRGLGLSEVVGLSLAMDIVVLFIGTLFVVARRAWDRRGEQRAVLDLVTELDQGPAGVHVIEHAQPMAYYLPGDGGRVVLSTGTLELLSAVEVEAIVAHEQGHRQGHHGHFLVPLQTLASFVGFLPLSRRAPMVMRGYLEMIADDFATSHSSRHAVRSALAKASHFQRPPLGAFGANDLLVERRLRRLEKEGVRAHDLFIAWTTGAAAVSVVIAMALVG
jgi:hypothetical protein